MRFTLFLISFMGCVLLGLSSTQAQLLLDDEKPNKNLAQERAQSFYKQCIDDPIVDLSDVTDQAFCACASANMLNFLTKEKIDDSTRAFYESAGDKTLDRQTMLQEVYASCLHIPVYEIGYYECYDDTRHRFFLKEPVRLKSMCQCIAEADQIYFEQFAKPYIEMQFAEGKDVIDPIDDIKYENNFYMMHYQVENECYLEYVNTEPTP